jgi:transcriptional regulator with XRE-family HTH domain
MKDLLDLSSLQVEETTGRIIRAFRKNFNLTLAEVSRLTDIPQSHLSAIENDKIEIGVKRASHIAAVFGIDPSLLLFPGGYERHLDREARNIRKKAAVLMVKKRELVGR